jgi:hypothetical protein
VVADLGLVLDRLSARGFKFGELSLLGIRAGCSDVRGAGREPLEGAAVLQKSMQLPLLSAPIGLCLQAGSCVSPRPQKHTGAARLN